MPSINIQPITIRVRRSNPAESDEVPWLRVLSLASTLQQAVPGAVLGCEMTAAIFGMHRHTREVDMLYPNLTFHMAEVLEALESRRTWRAALPGCAPGVLRGALRGVEVVIRDFSRAAPLQLGRVLIEGISLVLPTPPEILRLKADLVIERREWRDFVDLGVLCAVLGREVAEEAFGRYDDLHGFGRVNLLRGCLLRDLPEADTGDFPVVNAKRCEEFYVVDHCCGLAALLRRWATANGRRVQ